MTHMMALCKVFSQKNHIFGKSTRKWIKQSYWLYGCDNSFSSHLISRQLAYQGHIWNVQYKGSVGVSDCTRKCHFRISEGKLPSRIWATTQCHKSQSATEHDPQQHENAPDFQDTKSSSILAEMLLEQNISQKKAENKSLHDIEKEINKILLSPEEQKCDDYDNHKGTDSDETVLEYLEKTKQQEHTSSTSGSADSKDDSDFVEEIKLSSKQAEPVPFTAPIYKNLPAIYGTPDPSLPASRVPCAGCGAHLHCQEPTDPGYMPSEVFKPIKYRNLWEHFCLRCSRMQQHKECLNVSVTPEEYTDVIKTVKNEHALVIVVIDVTDLPHSIFPNLSELIGRKRPLFVVGNKIDLIPKDSTGYLQRIRESLMEMSDDVGLTETNFVKHVCLVSSKTGYGIEELITKLLHVWERQGHVYILGCTNAGKSSLFNAFLRSDYCNSYTSDIIQRATVSVWPGTTLNILKFPIMDPTPWRLHRRVKRLMRKQKDEVEETKLRKSLARESKGKERRELSTLRATVGRTQFTEIQEEDFESHNEKFDAMYSFNKFNKDDKDRDIKVASSGPENIRRQLNTESFDWKAYNRSRWCYDTPGVVNPEQVINYLTQSELEVVQPPLVIQPRTFIVKPGYVLFVSGLGKIHYYDGPVSTYFTVLASSKIPVHVVSAQEEDDFYHDKIGTEAMGIPLGDEERLSKIPPLAPEDFELTGVGWEESVGDIILSSIGWVAVTGGRGMKMKVRAFTPGGFGCKIRFPPLLPFAVNLRGKRIRGTPSYKLTAPLL